MSTTITPQRLDNNFILGIFFLFMISVIVNGKFKEHSLSQVFKDKSIRSSPFKSRLNISNLKFLIPFLPLIIVGIILLIKPYYLFPTAGDLDFHLVRAREILEQPIYGLFWDYLVYYPVGRALWHPPLFHIVLAALWHLGGVRFAHSMMCMVQILLSMGVVSWYANKKYGPYAGFLAGIFILCSPRADTLNSIMPATFFSIISILTIYYLPKNGRNAVILTITGIWTHMVGSVLFLLFLVTEKGRNYLKNWKLLLPLLSSIIFWALYWIYFKNKTGANNHIGISITLYPYINPVGLLFLLFFGIIGLIFLYYENKEDFKLFSTYILILIIVQTLFGDISRGFQYAAFPLAILSSSSIIKIYGHIQENNKRVLPYFLASILLCTIIASSSFLVPHIITEASWNNLNKPFENEYHDYHALNTYLIYNTTESEILWANTNIADKIAWINGKKVSNGRYGAPPNFIEGKQNLNIYQEGNEFIIKNSKNATVTIITD